ncbi:hypothetical protein VI817_000110 [Penicillium citrinum]|nr:hypothetical protein VI817_000110 [Penicillium citrinum]
MGHAYASTYQTYMNQRIQSHVQAAFLGVPSEDALMNILSHQSRYIDPRAPSTYEDLPESEKIAFSNDSGIQRLQQMRDALALEAKELYGSIKNAEGTKIGELKMKADATLRTAKKKLKESRFNGAREKFFATIDTLEINKQLDPSLMDIKQDAYEPERIVHRLEQRRRVAELMQISGQDLSVTQDTARRIELIDALVQLGRIEKIPSERPIRAAMPRNTSISQVSPEEISQDASPPPEPRKRPVSLTNRHCLFCVFAPNYQCFFASSRKAREHFEKHMRGFNCDELIECPDRLCGLAFRGHIALKNHAERVHSVRYFTESQRRKAGF